MIARQPFSFAGSDVDLADDQPVDHVEHDADAEQDPGAHVDVGVAAGDRGGQHQGHHRTDDGRPGRGAERGAGVALDRAVVGLRRSTRTETLTTANTSSRSSTVVSASRRQVAGAIASVSAMRR